MMCDVWCTGITAEHREWNVPERRRKKKEKEKVNEAILEDANTIL